LVDLTPAHADARDRILAASGLHPVRHLGADARHAVDWLARQDETIVDGIVQLLGMARALAPEPPRPRARTRDPLPQPRRLPTDTAGNSGP
jgi:hypothetical protein